MTKICGHFVWNLKRFRSFNLIQMLWLFYQVNYTVYFSTKFGLFFCKKVRKVEARKSDFQLSEHQKRILIMINFFNAFLIWLSFLTNQNNAFANISFIFPPYLSSVQFSVLSFEKYNPLVQKLFFLITI